MIKQLTFDELINELSECYLKIFKFNILQNKDSLFFVFEEHLAKDRIDNSVVFSIKKSNLLTINQFRELYQLYCDEARMEMKLVLVTLEPIVIIGIEISEQKGNPYGLVNVAFASAIPDENYSINIIE